MAIYKTRESPAAYVISAQGVWRPGVFDSEHAARCGQRLRDEEINDLYEHVQSLRGLMTTITKHDIVDYRANRVAV